RGGLLTVGRRVVTAAADAVVVAAFPVQLVVAAAAEQGVRAVVAGEDVVAGRALDLLGAVGDVAGGAVGDAGGGDGAADRRCAVSGAGVVAAGEGGAVVGARAAVEGVPVAGLAADHQVGPRAAVHRRRT